MRGYTGKLLRIDLNERKIAVEKITEELAREYLGGRGWGAKILFDELDSRIDPFSPENKIIISTGPLNGTGAYSFSKCCINSISALTGGCNRSMVGGHFAAELKFAGWDGIIIEGRAETKKPVYILIRDSKVEIRDASKYWGMTTNVFQETLRKELNDTRLRFLCIGPAGERLVRYAALISDRRAAGRGGTGAIMGSKNLKGIAVRGTGKVEVADSEGFKQANSKVIEFYKSDKMIWESFRKYGTQIGPNFFSELGIFPTRNYKFGQLKGVEKISDEALHKYWKKNTACYRCPIHCGNLLTVEDGPYKGVVTEGPEYETLFSFGGACEINYAPAIIAADMYCDQYGLDTISTGATIGFAMECYEKGLLTKGDTGGVELRFGDHELIVNLVRKIAYREGIGDLLAEGVKRVSERIGKESEEFAMHVKGLELPGYDPRGSKGQGLGYATNPRGGCHCQGYSIQEKFGIPEEVDRFSIKEKARMMKWEQEYYCLLDSMIGCLFPGQMSVIKKINVYTDLLAPVTGIKEFSELEYLFKIGERIFNLERLINIRQGLKREDDTLPKRLLFEPMPEGPCKGQVVELESMLNEYYELRGWHKNTGIPKGVKLKELGLDVVVEK
mgnify:CR=1 FL=1